MTSRGTDASHIAVLLQIFTLADARFSVLAQWLACSFVYEIDVISTRVVTIRANLPLLHNIAYFAGQTPPTSALTFQHCLRNISTWHWAITADISRATTADTSSVWWSKTKYEGAGSVAAWCHKLRFSRPDKKSKYTTGLQPWLHNKVP